MIKSSLPIASTSRNQYWKSTHTMPPKKKNLNDTINYTYLVTFAKVFSSKFPIVVFNNVLHIIRVLSHSSIFYKQQLPILGKFWQDCWKLIGNICHFFLSDFGKWEQKVTMNHFISEIADGGTWGQERVKLLK